MRDDIHKNAPVPPRWKRTIKAAANDADWAAEGVRRMDDAVRGELSAIQAGTFLDRLADALRDQAGVLPGLRNADDLRRVADPRNAAQDCLIGHVARSARLHGPAQVDVAEAVADTAQEIIDRHFHSTEEHCARKFPSQRRELMRRMNSCRSEIDLQGLATVTASGSLAARPNPRPSLNLDEGLPLGKEGRRRG